MSSGHPGTAGNRNPPEFRGKPRGGRRAVDVFYRGDQLPQRSRQALGPFR